MAFFFFFGTLHRLRECCVDISRFIFYSSLFGSSWTGETRGPTLLGEKFGIFKGNKNWLAFIFERRKDRTNIRKMPSLMRTRAHFVAGAFQSYPTDSKVHFKLGFKSKQVRQLVKVKVGIRFRSYLGIFFRFAYLYK